MSDIRVHQSRAALRQALLDLLPSLPWERITIRDIAERAGVGYTTYFRHYPNKDALLEDVAAAEIAALTAFAAPIYDAVDSRAACLALCRFVDEHRPLWSALLTGGAASIMRQQLLQRGRVTAITRREESWLPGELGLLLAVSGMVELLTWWLLQADPLAAERVAEIMDRAIISPIER